MKFLSLYKVENLDTRFQPTTTTSSGSALPDSKAPKWKSPEYIFYYIIFLIIPPLMFKAVYDVSQPPHPGYSSFAHLLSPGWIPGRPWVDNSDAQYASFRGNVPYMALLLVLHPVLRMGFERLFFSGARGEVVHANGSGAKLKEESAALDVAGNGRLEGRLRFDLGFGLVFLLALHGFSAFKVLAIVYFNYLIATRLPKSYVGGTTWVFNIGILFANELCRGYPFAKLFSLISPPTTANVIGEKAAAAMNWGAWLDTYGGLIPRWEVLFNFTVLRLIAFNFDFIWMLDRRSASPVEKKNLHPSTLPEKDRIKTGASPHEFSLRNYLSYILYSPLFLAGPIVNFNDYISQSRYPLPSLTPRSRIILPYALRFIICLLTMELLLHNIYAVAISKAHPNWQIYSPFQLSMLGYFNLHIIWLKLLLPWRFFRLWALLDGIDPPENMVRCMSDNYSTLAFWRSWHRSFNQWVMRYIYIPLGGSRVGKIRAVANFVAVFTFVAVWHDINLRVLVWGWLIVLFVLPEVVATLVFPARKWKDSPEAYRWLCGVGAVGNILMMMAANLVGFALGLDGLRGLVEGIVGGWGGRVFLLAACGTLFVGVQVMFEVREAEKRRGINMKC